MGGEWEGKINELVRQEQMRGREEASHFSTDAFRSGHYGNGERKEIFSAAETNEKI